MPKDGHKGGDSESSLHPSKAAIHKTRRNTPNFNAKMKNDTLSTRSKKARQTKPQTPKTDFFTTLCRSDLHVECVKEFRFHPERRWRFDYAIPSHKIAVEVEGGVWTGGRHTSPKGFLNDMEKYNAAALLGWRVFRYVPDTLHTTATLQMLRTAIQYTKTQYDKCIEK